MARTASGFLLTIIFLLALQTPSPSLGAGFGNMSSSSYRLYNGSTGTLGGYAYGITASLNSSNMSPYYQSSDDLGPWYQKAQDDLEAGKDFRTYQLGLAGVFANSSTAQGRMLSDPKLNYETSGILANFPEVENQLIGARNTFAYDVSIGYPFTDPAQAQAKLNDTVKTLANNYLLIADEFLIDALEFRFSSDTLGVDQKLDEQIALLSKAQSYYQKAVDSFVYGFSPAVGSNIYIANYFDDTVYSLFNLAAERLSLALREKTSKQLVRQMAPDATQEWSASSASSRDSIRDVLTSTYLVAAATAKRQGDNFLTYGGASLASALDDLRKQGNIYSSGLNPLGYDNRYIPMNDYTDLYNLANGWLIYAQEAAATLKDDKRAFDANVDAYRNEKNSLDSHYITSLSNLTGCSYPDPDSPTEVDDFLTCTGQAGGDLFSCRVEMGASAFDACISAKATKGQLAAKYRAIMSARTQLDSARLNRQNILERIKNETERVGKLVQLKRASTESQAVALDAYYDKLQNARQEKDTITETTVREKQGGKWVKKNTTKDHTTTTTFTIKDDSLKIDAKKEKEILAITSDFDIAQTNLDSAYRIKDMLLDEASAEIQVEAATQQYNSAILEFDTLYQEKETEWFFYEHGLDGLSYFTTPDKYATQRILKSEAAINLSETMNYTVHYAYLAAKALEYKYLKPIVDEPVAGGRLRLTDLFKAQTPEDAKDFLLKLNALNTQNCPWGTFDPQYNTISLAYHILGLTDGFLDPDGDGRTDDGKTVSQARKERVQSFIAQNMQADGSLRFKFGLSEENSYLANSGLYNMKIWNGSVSSPCDQLVSEVKGVSVSLQTTQTSSIRPKVRLKQSGHSSLRNQKGEIVEYIPVSQYHLLFEEQGDAIPSKEAEIIASVNVDPRFQNSTGTWTGAFKGRGIASSAWEVTVFDWNALYPKTDYSKITDVWINIDTIGECCYSK